MSARERNTVRVSQMEEEEEEEELAATLSPSKPVENWPLRLVVWPETDKHEHKRNLEGPLEALTNYSGSLHE